ncbi:MAG TPA: ABC transporter permease [Candidatus Avilachnospira avistercoris]|nr:ABC transporter permease [Candidatus Avilachnospira avistercoris]
MSSQDMKDIKLNDELQLEIGERDGIRDKLKKMCRQNHLAAISAIVILIIILMAVFAPVIAPYGETEAILIDRLQGPSMKHLLGTDELGRDLFSRMLYGSRLSIAIGILPSLISLVIGVAAGLTAGYFGGKIDYVIMRIADVMLSIPSLLLAMVVMYTLGTSTVNLFVALSMTGWSSVARVVRSQTLSIKESEYVEAARSIGVSRFKIMTRHILPNCIPSLIVLFTLNVPSAILSESSLSFLGIGVRVPQASWGLIVNQGRQFLFTQPWLCMAPCVAIMIVVLAFNFLGDGLRDVLDPYMQR